MIFRAIKWLVRNFFLLATAVLAGFYLYWFRIAPFSLANESTFGLTVGIVLLTVSGLLAIALSRARSIFFTVLLYLISIPFLSRNVTYLNIHIPRIETSAKCNGATYYITYGKPLWDEQWTYVQMSKWKGLIYESQFWGYSNARGNEIRCDTGKKETLFLRLFGELPPLTYIDGESPQDFYTYASAQLGDSLYFLSEDWSVESCADPQSCHIYTYTLYKCTSSYTDCNPLPITYTGNVDFLELKADETTKEISLFVQYFESWDDILVFTYGKNSRCYVNGCAINTK